MRSATGGRSGGTGGESPEEQALQATLEAVERAAGVICKRWKPALLYLLGSGHQRYNALARQLPATTSKMLTQQLRELERDGLLLRTARSGGPRHVEYTLTPMGAALHPVVAALAAWGRDHHDALRSPRPEVAAPDREREIPRPPVRPADAGRPPAGRYGADPRGREWRPGRAAP